MLAELSFDMSQPYSLQFLRRYVQSIKDRLEGETYTSAKYLLELSVLGKLLKGFKIPSFYFRTKFDWNSIFDHCSSCVEIVNESLSARFEMG